MTVKDSKPRNLSLEEFKSVDQAAATISHLERISTEGSLLACHALVFRNTGLWFPELVGPFAALDSLATKGG